MSPECAEAEGPSIASRLLIPWGNITDQRFTNPPCIISGLVLFADESLVDRHPSNLVELSFFSLAAKHTFLLLEWEVPSPSSIIHMQCIYRIS